MPFYRFFRGCLWCYAPSIVSAGWDETWMRCTVWRFAFSSCLILYSPKRTLAALPSSGLSAAEATATRAEQKGATSSYQGDREILFGGLPARTTVTKVLEGTSCGWGALWYDALLSHSGRQNPILLLVALPTWRTEERFEALVLSHHRRGVDN